MRTDDKRHTVNDLFVWVLHVIDKVSSLCEGLSLSYVEVLTVVKLIG